MSRSHRGGSFVARWAFSSLRRVYTILHTYTLYWKHNFEIQSNPITWWILRYARVYIASLWAINTHRLCGSDICGEPWQHIASSPRSFPVCMSFGDNIFWVNYRLWCQFMNIRSMEKWKALDTYDKCYLYADYSYCALRRGMIARTRYVTTNTTVSMKLYVDDSLLLLWWWSRASVE